MSSGGGGDGDGRQWTASPSNPRLPPFYEPLCGDRGPSPGPPQPHPAGRSPWTTPHGGGAARQPPRWGGGRMPYWAPAPLLARRARLAGPRRTRGSTPGSHGRVHHTATARTPLPRRGGAPTIRGRHRWRGPGQHPGPTLESPAASCPGPPAPLGRARPPLALGRRDGDPFRRGNCDGPSLGPHTPGSRFPGNMPHSRMFQMVPLATHL